MKDFISLLRFCPVPSIQGHTALACKPPPTSCKRRGNPILAHFSLIFLLPVLLCCCPLCPGCSRWPEGLSSALAQSTLLSTEMREAIINIIKHVSWTNPAWEEPGELSDGELMVTSISWISKWERQAPKPIYSVTRYFAVLKYFGHLSVCFIRLFVAIIYLTFTLPIMALRDV